MTAYYNEIDPYAAQWLRNLIEAGHIAPGVVDERSIEDVKPEEIRGFTQCHFFAGIGVWSLALRRAGWSDNKPVWTGSCPCQPFSAAGKGAGFVDERHLWPAWDHLITQCEPPVVFGEQVASKDGLGWLDLVLSDLEGAGYASGAVDLCAAGVGAPHIRQRSWFVAERVGDPSSSGLPEQQRVGGDSREEGRAAQRETPQRRSPPVSGLADSDRIEWGAVERPPKSEGGKCGEPHGDGCESSGLADSESERRSVRDPEDERAAYRESDPLTDDSASDPLRPCEPPARTEPGPTNGLWGAADWLFCRDGKWRPVEPGTSPLANGAPSRVGRLRAYGNAINAQAAETFIRGYLG